MSDINSTQWADKLEKIKKDLHSLKKEKLNNILQSCLLLPTQLSSTTEEWTMKNVHLENLRVEIQISNILMCIQQILRELSMLKCASCLDRKELNNITTLLNQDVMTVQSTSSSIDN